MTGNPFEARFASAELLSAVLESTDALVVVSTADGAIRHVNAAFLQTTGYTATDVLDMPVWNLRPPRLREEARRAFLQAEAGTAGRRFETLWQAKDGSERPVSVSTRSLPGAAPQADLRVGTAIDLTDMRRAQRQSQDLAQLLNQAAEAIIRVDAARRIVWCNRAAEQLYGYGPGEMLGMSNRRFIPPHQHAAATAFAERIRATRQAHAMETTRLRKDGSEVWVSLRVSPTLDDAGEIVGLVSISFDISRVRQAEADAQRLVDMLDNLADPVLRLDHQGIIRYANAAAESMYGRDSGSLVGQPVQVLQPPDAQQDLWAVIGTAMHASGSARLEARLADRHAQVIPAELHLTSIRAPGGDHHDVACVAYDLRERKQVEADLRHAASTDTLTGLHNRLSFEQRCEVEMSRARRRGHPLCVIAADIDHFKAINDTHGHAAGDKALKRFAQILVARLRSPVDFVARLGGEEFAMVLPETTLGVATQVAERLRVGVAAQTLVLNDLPATLTASFGVSQWHADEASMEAALVRADQGIYAAKFGGRDQISVQIRTPRVASPAPADARRGAVGAGPDAS